MKKLLFSLLLCSGFVVNGVWGQEGYFDLNFDKDTVKVYELSPNQKHIVEIGITGKFLTDNISKIKIEKQYSDLPENSKIDFNFTQKDYGKLNIGPSKVMFNEKFIIPPILRTINLIN